MCCHAAWNVISAVQLPLMQSDSSLQHTQQDTCGRIIAFDCQRTLYCVQAAL